MTDAPKRPGGDGLDQALRELYNAPVPASFQNEWRNAIVREEKQTMSMEKKRKNGWLRGALPVAAAVVLIWGASWVGSQNLGFDTGAANSGYTVATPRSAKSSAGGTALYAAMPNSAESMASTEASYDMATDVVAADNASGQSVTPEAADARKLVRTANLTIRTDAYDEDLSAIYALIDRVNGYTESVYADGDGSDGATRSANLTVRVPSASLDEFLSGLGGIGRVVGRSESVEDKTVQYADNEARLNTLREKMSRLNALLAKAENVADIIEIESAIADTQYAIDRFETTQRTIDRDADMSQVYLNLREDSPTNITSEMSLGERISAGFQASVKGLGRFLRNMVVFLAMALPALAAIAAVVVAVVLIRKAVRKKKGGAGNTTEEAGPPERPKEEE